MLIRSIVTTATLLLTGAAHAATLTIELGNSDGYNVCTVGSCFGFDHDSSHYSVADPDEFINIAGFQGLIVDGLTVQPAAGSHAGPPDGSETPGVDLPWEWFGNTGMHYTNAPLTKTGGAGNSLFLDLTGLQLIYNTFAPGRYEALVGIYEDASVTCQFNCGDGESYLLTYRMLFSAECGPEGDPSCFGRQYQYEFLTLRGTIIGNDLANVPAPAAAWLFASGLFGLIGASNKKYRLDGYVGLSVSPMSKAGE